MKRELRKVAKQPPLWLGDRPTFQQQLDAMRQEVVVKCACNTSTGICGHITRGTGKLDDYGYWEFPCPHGNDMVEHEDDFTPYRSTTAISTGE